MMHRLFPFLSWFPLTGQRLRSDLLAGMTVSLVLIPQAMAYAQLAGLPAYYGLYAAILPVMVAALWGSSAQLATGPVAVVSLLTASALSQLAVPGSEQYITLAILLALLVGVIQLFMGVFNLGVLEHFLSHPMIVGFLNAAAIIIGLSQLGIVFGVPMPYSGHFINDIWVVLQQIGSIHIPTFIMGVSAFAIMLLLRLKAPRLPGILIVVVCATFISYVIGFEKNARGKVEQIADTSLQALVRQASDINARAGNLTSQSPTNFGAVRAEGELIPLPVQREYEPDMSRVDIANTVNTAYEVFIQLRQLWVVRQIDNDGNTVAIYPANKAPADVRLDNTKYQIRGVFNGEFMLHGGGDVLGSMPSGLPDLAAPAFSWDTISSLLAAAFVISLVGFMEVISIAKSMAAKTKQRIDPNQGLLGVGLANIVGSFSQTFPVSGSFPHSAANLNAGAKTGMALIFAGLIVLVTLSFLTPLLYHLPQVVLAAIILLAVTSLINFKAIKDAWYAHKQNGIIAVVVFVATLGFAPHLDSVIIVGICVALLHYMYRALKPRMAILGRNRDGTLCVLTVSPQLRSLKEVVAMRFDGSLDFANVYCFEDKVLEIHSSHPDAKFILVAGDDINQFDASGGQVIQHLSERLNANGVTLVLSGFKQQFLDMMEGTGLRETIGEGNIFASEDKALESIYRRIYANNSN